MIRTPSFIIIIRTNSWIFLPVIKIPAYPSLATSHQRAHEPCRTRLQRAESGSPPPVQHEGEERSYWNAANETDVHDVASWRGLAARKISLFLTGKQFCRGTADGLLFAESVIPVPRRDSNIERETCLLDARRKEEEEEEEEDGPQRMKQRIERASFARKTFLGFFLVPPSYKGSYPFTHRMTIHPYNSAPSVRKDVFGEENKKYIFFSFSLPFFLFFFNSTLQILRYSNSRDGIYAYIYIWTLEEIEGWWYWWKIYDWKFVLGNCGLEMCGFVFGGDYRVIETFSFSKNFSKGEEKVAGSSNSSFTSGNDSWNFKLPRSSKEFSF